MSALRQIEITPKAPTIERCLARASVSTITPTDYPSTLFYLFGLQHAQSADLPTAPYCRLADGGQDDAGYWLQASPVHLRPDGDALLLFDADHLEISLDEANQLAALVRKHFSDMGWKLEVYSPERWYLRLEHKPDILTIPLIDVIGRNVRSFFLPSAESAAWESILNEVQMLLHMSQVNMLRKGKGQLSINGLWLHGGGSLHPIADVDYAAVTGDRPLLRGMAQVAGIAPVALPQTSAELIPVAGKVLIEAHVLERPVLDADPYGWVESIARLDAWLEPLLKAVGTKRLSYINLYPCNGAVYRIDAGGMRRFWRLRRPLSDYLL